MEELDRFGLKFSRYYGNYLKSKEHLFDIIHEHVMLVQYMYQYDEVSENVIIQLTKHSDNVMHIIDEDKKYFDCVKKYNLLFIYYCRITTMKIPTSYDFPIPIKCIKVKTINESMDIKRYSFGIYHYDIQGENMDDILFPNILLIATSLGYDVKQMRKKDIIKVVNESLIQKSFTLDYISNIISS